MSVETGMELALTDTVQVTKENQISTGDGLPSAEWQMDIPTVQEKIGVMYQTLHERRPLTKTNTHGRVQETEWRDRNQENAKLPKEQQERVQVHREDRCQAKNTVRAEPLVRDAKEKEEI